MTKTGIHWFRHGLRIHDNPALFACLDEVERFIPIFIFDGKAFNPETCGYNRFRFLLQSLKDLEIQFAALKINFMCFYGDPHEVLAKIIKECNVKILSFEKDTEAIWRERDNLVKTMCKDMNVQVIEIVSNTLYDPDVIFSRNNNMAPNTCEQLKEICLQIGSPDKPAKRPDLVSIASRLKSTDSLYNKEIHRVPDLEFFSMKPEHPDQAKCLYEGGETIALKLFRKRLEYEKEYFEQGNVNPNWSKSILFTKETSFSSYITFGCLSVRKFYWQIRNNFDKYFTGPKISYEPTDQIFWREYFYQMSYKNKNLGQINNNPMAIKIPWDYNDVNNLFPKWEQAKTGFPWIDACMRKLLIEGWIHHACRVSLAIFLTRGHLFLTWELGLKTFLKYQIDADWSVCAGNWSWISSGSPSEALYDTFSFCPVQQGLLLDPNGEFTKKYIKELKDYPIEYLFEPWKAPLSVQEASNCIIGKDYPLPCIDHEKAFRENVKKMRKYFGSMLNEDFENFLKKKLKPSNAQEYKSYIFASVFLNGDVKAD